jgi:DNA (cytosine-5)-methyltransferase 1
MVAPAERTKSAKPRSRDAALARWYARGVLDGSESAGDSPAAAPPSVLDLFCGAGGFTRGFAAAGFRPVFAVDLDPACVATYGQNFGPHAVAGDLDAMLDARGDAFPAADVVVGGPPCQGFSLLNKKRRADPRKALWRSYLEVVRRVRPAVFVMENVPELLASAEFEELRVLAETAGYRLAFDVLSAADFGVPQKRRRAIVIGARETSPRLPAPTHADPAVARARGLAPWRTVADALDGLPEPVGREIRRDASDALSLHFGRAPTKTSRARYRAVPAGGNRFDLQRRRPDLTPRCWVEKTSGGTDLFGRLWWDRPSVTIRTEFFKPEKGRYLHPEAHRPITHREAARLQTFPDAFAFSGSKSAVARQIGNAVPCLLAAAIARDVRALLRPRGT